MRVTREALIRIAKETTQERAYNNKDIIAAYLTGALAAETDPMLGGTADIDLVFVHTFQPTRAREFVKLTSDFHVDIHHRARAEFKLPRELRGDPWLGYEMFAPMLLYEREKFFDFVQAALRAGFEFEGPALTLERSRKLLGGSRKIWMQLNDREKSAGPEEIRDYLNALFQVANAVAELNGPPIHERRLLLEFPARAEAAEHPGMTAALTGLLGANLVGAEELSAWLAGWRSAFEAASQNPGAETRINSIRLNYYEKAVRSMLEGESPQAAVWPMIHTWTLAALALPEDQNNEWRAACDALGLLGEKFAERVEGLDHFLDEVEIMLDEIAAANGLEPSTTL